MPNAVIILGAGASNSFGVPTLRNLFKDTHARQYLAEDGFLTEQLLQHFWEPRGRNLETSDEGLNIEEILTLIRDSEIRSFGLDPLPIDNVERFKRSLYVLIKKAVYDGKDSRGRYLNSIISYAKSKFDETTWASFNWDCIFESSFYYSGGFHPYERTNPTVAVNLQNWRSNLPNHYFLKLHGGVNWWSTNGQLRYLQFGGNQELNNLWNAYRNEQEEANSNPVILEPSFYKYDDVVYEQLRPQWNFLTRKLIEADFIIVIGYSLADYDSEARSALTLAYQNNQDANWIIIDPSDSTCSKYVRLFGSRNLSTFRDTLEDFNEDLENTLDRELGL